MKHVTLFTALFILAVTGSAHALMIDFNSLGPGTYSESEFNNFFDGVYFENNGGSFDIAGDSSNHYVDDNYAGPRQDIERFEPYFSTTATFDFLTDSVSITHLNDMPHSVMLFMRIFDVDHNLLSQISEVYIPADPFLPLTSFVLEYDSGIANIASVEFWSDDFNYTQGDGYWDNFTFNDVQPIPEPATILMLSFGLVGIFGKRKLSKSIAK
jgi:hypothetical protein